MRQSPYLFVPALGSLGRLALPKVLANLAPGVDGGERRHGGVNRHAQSSPGRLVPTAR
jgi:hypothetical protein